MNTFNQIPIKTTQDWEITFAGYCVAANGNEATAAHNLINDLDGLNEDQKFALERLVGAIAATSYRRGYKNGLEAGGEIYGEVRGV
jgi:hypothetical protein